MRQLHPGEVLDGRYEIRRVIGEGGSGLVYEALQTDIQRPVVVKTLLPDVTTDPTDLARLELEAQVTAELSHPNIVSVYDFGREGDIYYMVMEKLEGLTLDKLVREQGAIEPRRVHNILMQILDGLAAAHAAGVVHRDLKPGNVHCSTHPARLDHVKIFDFGIAKHVDGRQLKNLTQAGFIVGTPGYLAPELLKQVPLSPRVDLYAAGVIAYELLTGKNAFVGGTSLAKLSAQANNDPEPPPLHIQHQPLWRVVRRLFQRDPDARYLSAQFALEDLATVKIIDSVETPKVPPGMQSLPESDATSNLRLSSNIPAAGPPPIPVAAKSPPTPFGPTPPPRPDSQSWSTGAMTPVKPRRGPLIFVIVVALLAVGVVLSYVFVIKPELDANETGGSNESAKNNDDDSGVDGPGDDGPGDDGPVDDGATEDAVPEESDSGTTNEGTNGASRDNTDVTETLETRDDEDTDPLPSADGKKDTGDGDTNPDGPNGTSDTGTVETGPGVVVTLAELPWRLPPIYPPPTAPRKPVAPHAPGPGEPGYSGCGDASQCLVAKVSPGAFAVIGVENLALGGTALLDTTVVAMSPVAIKDDGSEIAAWIDDRVLLTTIDLDTDGGLPTRLVLLTDTSVVRRSLASYQRDELFDIGAKLAADEPVPLAVDAPPADFVRLIERTSLRPDGKGELLVHGIRGDTPVRAVLLSNSGRVGFTAFPDSAPVLMVSRSGQASQEAVLLAQTGCDIPNEFALWTFDESNVPRLRQTLRDALTQDGAPDAWNASEPDTLYFRLGHDGTGLTHLHVWDDLVGCRVGADAKFVMPLFQ